MAASVDVLTTWWSRSSFVTGRRAAAPPGPEAPYSSPVGSNSRLWFSLSARRLRPRLGGALLISSVVLALTGAALAVVVPTNPPVQLRASAVSEATSTTAGSPRAVPTAVTEAPPPTTVAPTTAPATAVVRTTGLTVALSSQQSAEGVVALAVHVRDTDGRWSGVGRTVVDFGDGSTRLPSPEDMGVCDTAPPWRRAAGSASSPLDETRTFTHSYRVAGAFHIAVQVITRVDCTDDGKDTASAALDAQVPITPGTTNGPQKPFARLACDSGSRGSLVARICLAGRDEDGWVDNITVDWGDGSAPTMVPLEKSDHCSDTPRTYPASERGARADHTYQQAGPFTMTFTAFSVGCDGADPQSSASTQTWTVPN